MKFKTTRTFTLGFVAGAAIFASSSSFAAATYEKITNAFINYSVKVSVDGKAVQLKNKPITYNNINYLPVAEIAKLLGATASWDSGKQIISISTSQQNPEPNTENQKIIETTFKGMRAIIVNGITYFFGGDYDRQISKSSGLTSAEWNKDITIMTIKNESITYNIPKSEMYTYKGGTYCNIKYYIKP